MKLTVNGKEEIVENITTLNELLTYKKLQLGRIAIEHNGNIVSKEIVSDVKLNENDIIEIVSFMGGG